MYKAGDHIIYGSTGVCEVKGITTPDFEKDKDRQYYVLEPVYQDGVIYTPVDTKAFMRPIITREEAHDLIDSIPDMQIEPYYNNAPRELEEYYNSYLKSHDCGDLLKLGRSIYIKRRELLNQHRKFGAVDERFIKRAEDLLYGELAVSLGIEKNEVETYIDQRVKMLNEIKSARRRISVGHFSIFKLEAISLPALRGWLR